MQGTIEYTGDSVFKWARNNGWDDGSFNYVVNGTNNITARFAYDTGATFLSRDLDWDAKDTWLGVSMDNDVQVKCYAGG